VDLIVIGAGSAGANAAISASEAGLSVVLVDEQDAAGGQVWRAPWPGLVKKPDTPEAREGAALRAKLAASHVEARFGRRVWSVTTGYRVDAIGPDGNETFTAPLLVAAQGAHERVVPFPGWTLPGVIGLAAATILLKSHAVLPGQRVVVAGCGPLLAAVAAGIVKAGGEVAAVADLAGPDDWLAAIPSFATRPRLLAQGIGWVLKLAAKRVPVYFRHGIAAASGEGQVQRVTLASVDADGALADGSHIDIEAHALCVGHGLVPGGEIAKLLRARHRYNPQRGGWVPECDAYGRTSLPGLFAVGDGSGIRGAAPAEFAGKLAGLAAACDAGILPLDGFSRLSRPLQTEARRSGAFANASARLMALRPAQVAAIAPDTVVCRCEDVTRGEIDAAFESGARDANQLKHFTRCGMGPCQGRMCGDVTAELLAQRVGSREAVGYWTGRPPFRPVALDALIGEFDYADIPIPEPAPL
jgi:thioredoxin reductase/bacterioferritin-associated ferredoxin